jgi:hypothetical protein
MISGETTLKLSATERKLRSELATLVARYDCGKVSPAIFIIIKQLETELAWLEHARAP